MDKHFKEQTTVQQEISLLELSEIVMPQRFVR